MDNKSVVFQILLTLGAFLIGSSVIALPQSIDRLFYSDPYYVVEQQIYERAQRHAIYSFIIANLATPDFDPFKYLPPSDQADLLAMLPDKTYTREVIVEFVMTRMSDNNRTDTALMTMWKNKKDSLQRIVTLGK
ncbi:hypothetical protein EB093_03585 [bacterium]|nr:hypothetical protein [bacterium]